MVMVLLHVGLVAGGFLAGMLCGGVAGLVLSKRAYAAAEKLKAEALKKL